MDPKIKLWPLIVGGLALLGAGIGIGVAIQLSVCQNYHMKQFADGMGAVDSKLVTIQSKLGIETQPSADIQGASLEAVKPPEPSQPSAQPAALQDKAPTQPTQPTAPPMQQPPRGDPSEQADLTAPKEWYKNASEYKTEAGSSPAIGPDSAVVKVFIISDFQCPVCRRAAMGMDSLYGSYGDKVQFIFWQNPLAMHSKAMPAAKASMAAHKQGKFWEFHNLIFANPSAMEQADFEGYAQKLGLDLTKFRADMESPETLAKITSDQAVTILLEAQGTPSFVINGKKQVGWGSAAGIRSMIDSELSAVEGLTKSGVSVDEARKKRVLTLSETPEQGQAVVNHMLDGKKATAPAGK